MMRWFRWLTFVFGWLLSPLTPWNDALLNLPIAYVMASLVVRVVPNSFSLALLVFYWLTNLAGILMVLWSGHQLIKARPLQVQSMKQTWFWMAVYSGLVLFLIWQGWLRPF